MTSEAQAPVTRQISNIFTAIMKLSLDEIPDWKTCGDLADAYFEKQRASEIRRRSLLIPSVF
jgi:hypothetical protein